jgi:hypothetical protein
VLRSVEIGLKMTGSPGYVPERAGDLGVKPFLQPGDGLIVQIMFQLFRVFW